MDTDEQPSSVWMRLAWGNKSMTARGPAVVIFLMWSLLVLAILYSGYRQEQSMAAALVDVRDEMRADHLSMARGQDRTSCGLLMSPEERQRFRLEYRAGAWRAWCPWMTNED